MSYINLLDIIYPVGSFYFSTEYDSPSGIIGGIWEQINAAVIRSKSIDGNSSNGYIGQDTCTLTVTQIPSHRHGIMQRLVNTSPQSNIGFYGNAGVTTTDVSAFTGGGEAHSIVQRSFNCYIWRRIS